VVLLKTIFTQILITMKDDLVELLRQRYPQIFAQRPEILCGDGWYDLVDALCESLQFATDYNKAPQVVAVQVKEKFGGLTFQGRDANEAQRAMIGMAAAMSARLCEQCGQPGQVLVHNSLYLTRCAAHAPAGAMPEADRTR
jgi:hypothetical protein